MAVTALRLVPTLHRLSRDYDFRANPLGKATTVVQFFAAPRCWWGIRWRARWCGRRRPWALVSVFIYVRRLGVPKWVN